MAENTSGAGQQQAVLQFALSNPAIPKIYGNGFGVNLGPHDVGVMFTLNDVPAGYVSLSYPFAKRLATLLSEAVGKYEEITKTHVASLVDLEAALKTASATDGGSL